MIRCLALCAIACLACDADVAGVQGDTDDEDFEPAPAATKPVTFTETGDYVDWSNSHGTFRIWKLCKGPLPGPLYIGFDGTVGPGYISTVWNRNGQIVLDDTHVASYLGPNSGATGLGMFGFHLARGIAPFTTKELNPDGSTKVDHTFQVGGRFCNANRRPDDYGGYRGYGVRSFSTIEAPRIAGGVGEHVIEVTLGDATSDVARVRYTYRIGSGFVKSWIRVTTLCDRGTCDAATAGGNAFVKEPKIIAGVNPPDPDAIGSGQMNIFNDGGSTATTLDRHNFWSNTCSSSPGWLDAGTKNNFLCEWGGQTPQTGTGQCNDPTRRRARFWHPGITCAQDPSCLVVAARGAPDELAPSTAWVGNGLDVWAQRNVDDGREQAGTTDSSFGGTNTLNCHNNSAAVANRRWEMAGYKKTAGCSYTNAVTSFHAWEGGSGQYDCEPLYYRFGPAGESYVVAMSYGFGTAPLP